LAVSANKTRKKKGVVNVGVLESAETQLFPSTKNEFRQKKNEIASRGGGVQKKGTTKSLSEKKGTK